MKKMLFGALFASMMLASCSNSDEPAPAQNDGEGTGDSSYVTISIASNNAPGSRADATYEDGTGNEAAVHNVVLFFFDESGNAFNVNMGGDGKSYKVITDITLTPGANDQSNVENWFTKTIQLQTKKVDKVKVLALVNANVRKVDGKDVVYNYKGTAPLNNSISMAGLESAIFEGDITGHPDYFVMSTSVYSKDGAVQRAVTIDVYPTQEAASANPAQLYVERVKARVKLTEKTGTFNNTFKPDLTGVTLPEGYSADQLKLKVLGWELNTTCKRANYYKQIQSSYSYTWTWNDADLHRCYWEDPVELIKSNDGNFTTSFTPNDEKTAPGDTYLYCNPNTTGASTATKALVYTQLLDNNDQPVTIATWYGVTYKIEDLKTAVLEAQNTQAGQIYVPDPSKAENKYVSVYEDYIEFEQGSGLSDASKSWRTYPVLKKKNNDDTDVAYYTKDTSAGIGEGSAAYNPISYDDAMVKIGFWNNAAEKKHALEGAKVWKDGLAYYFVDIKHFGDQIGVVRNHSYNVEINGFKGLGTPIYDPKKEIPEPDLPEDDQESFISVKMNVLSWRIVPTQKVILGQ